MVCLVLSDLGLFCVFQLFIQDNIWGLGDHFQFLKVLVGIGTFWGCGTTSRFLVEYVFHPKVLYRNCTNSYKGGTKLVFRFYDIFIIFYILGWIRTGHGITNAFVDYEFHRFHICWHFLKCFIKTTCNKQDYLLYIACWLPYMSFYTSNI